MSVTFSPDPIAVGSPVKRYLPWTWKTYEIDSDRIEATSVRSGTLCAPYSGNALLDAFHRAYSYHLPLRLTPDAIWMTIAAGAAQHIRLNAEKLRRHFVAHEGQATLVVDAPDFVKGAQNDWPSVFAGFDTQLAEHIGKKRDLFVADFTTTTPLTRAATQLVLMDAMQSFFKYEVRTLCGLPRITLEGTPEDWRSVRARAQALAELDCPQWLDRLLPVLDHFVLAAEGRPELSHWRRAVREDGSSGGPHVSGWVLAFFPYLRHGHPIGAVCNPFDIPPAIGSAPVLWRYGMAQINLRFLGGLFGVESEDDNVTVAPHFGWAVVHDDAK